MQTFLPYESFTQSAVTLDVKRLGKQRVETMQIMNALLTPAYGWQNHPAVKMWRGHHGFLFEYQIAVCYVWTRMYSYKDTCLEKTRRAFELIDTPSAGPPPWLGDDELHESHRSNLIRKKPDFYAPMFPGTRLDLDYVWPVS